MVPDSPKRSEVVPASQAPPPRRSPLTFLIPVVLVGLVFGVGVYRLVRPSPVAVTPQPVPSAVPPSAETPADPVPQLSLATRRVLGQLQSEVDIRFYVLMPATEEAVRPQAFAGRVARLLDQFERFGRGHVKVHRIESGAGEADAAALADGLESMLPGAKSPHFLGISLSCEGRRAVIPKLAEPWEEALEFDLSRAIERISGGTTVAGSGGVRDPVTPESATARTELLQTFPEIKTMQYYQARQRLLRAGQDEFEEVASTIRRQREDAQRRVAEAKNEGAAAVNQARKELAQLRRQHQEMMRAISARTEARLAALEQMHEVSP